jgi:phosphohistidine phosphatase
MAILSAGNFIFKEVDLLMPHLVLILARHAEASLDSDTDHGRMLTSHGRTQSHQVGIALAMRQTNCDLAIISSATRAQQTFEGISRSYPTARQDIVDELYTVKTVQDFTLALKSRVEDPVMTLLVVGHNPIISAAASVYTGASVQFAPSEFIVLTQNAPSWTEAFDLDGCWSITP